MDNKLKIINYLGKHGRKQFTMHGLSIVVGIPYASFYRAVQQMKDLLECTTIGKSKTLTLKRENPIIHSYLTISSDEERKEFLRKQPLIMKIASELRTKDILILFGSYAKRKETEKSDIDLLVVNKDGKKSLSFSKYEVVFKKKINPIFFTAKEFKIMLQDPEENVGKQALQDHIILNNPDGFWRMVLHGL